MNSHAKQRLYVLKGTRHTSHPRLYVGYFVITLSAAILVIVGLASLLSLFFSWLR